jgi:4-amino-4-deoxy-L-arabinose transferase
MKIFTSLYRHAWLLLIFATGVYMRIKAAFLDPFLHDWDERYHALVAANMMKHPFMPMLNKAVFSNYDSQAWCCNHIWLHKQPLFLWQIATALKLFGTSTFVLRLPSVIMGSVMILLLYRICMLLTKNKLSSLFSAMLLSFSFYQLQLISGRKGMDHNDVAFGFYILCSFWSFCEYLNAPVSKGWVILTGIFAGCAVLNKWLTGILVFAPWGLLVLNDLFKTKDIKVLKDMLLGLACCVLVFLPWQLYIFYRFPAEALHEYRLNTMHLFNVLEGHKGDLLFYVSKLDDYFGQNIFVFLLIGLGLVLSQKRKWNHFHFTMIFSLLLVFIFFSCVVKTKIDTFVFIAVPFGMLYAGMGFDALLGKLKIPFQIKIVIAFICTVFLCRPLQLFHPGQQLKYSAERIYNDSVYRQVKKMIPADTRIVLNAYTPGHYDLMFYHPDLIARDFWIEEKYLQVLAKYKIRIAAFDNHIGNHNPAFLLEYPYLYIIPVELKVF